MMDMKTHKKLLLRPVALLTTGLILLLSACLKKSDDILVPDPAMPFKGQDLIKTLNSQPSLHLFNLAVKRAALTESVGANSGYTIFALTDSAMKARGLDSAGISKLNIDSLQHLISYQIGIGIFDDKQLTDNPATLQVLTLKQQVKKLPTGAVLVSQAPLFLKESGKLYFNGVPVNKSGPVIAAYNGYIYPVSDFMSRIPTLTIGDVLNTDQELSMFNQALIIADSVFVANTGFNAGVSLPAFFSAPPSAQQPAMLPTLLAPTNKAFNDAGFHTADDLREFATRYLPSVDFNDFATIHYSSLDSLLGRHILLNTLIPPYSIRVMYYDLLNPMINNGIYNTFVGGWTSTFSGVPGDVSALKYKVPLNFSNKNGVAYVKWSSDPAVQPERIPLDASPLHPVYNYVTSNGALYKIDKLFFPIQK